MRVIGTAGHVDHGKSTLVKALTGINPDRLREEQEREMTIDLGFAWMTLPSGQSVSLVDVPGHEAFIKNMLAGVGGIDAALLVIAADEGVMPQTREHLAILDLLQVKGGVVALTKIDMIHESGWLELVTGETREALAGTILAEAPIVPVSAKTGEGLPELQVELDHALSHVREKEDHGRPRLPVDRVFSMSGFGTVVTGTLSDGSFAVGDEVEVAPSGLRCRIRGVQAHKEKISRVQPGGRTALNLVGIDTSQTQRGDTVILPGTYLPTGIIDARIRWLDSAPRSLAHNQWLDLFAFASQVPSRIRLLEGDQLRPGEAGWAQLVLSSPIVVTKGDRFILRYASPSLTVGGGVIVDPHPASRHRRGRSSVIANLERAEQGTPAELVLQYLESHGPTEFQGLAKLVGLDGPSTEAAVQDLVRADNLVEIKAERAHLLLARPAWTRLKDRMAHELLEYHKQFPLRAGMPREEFKSRLSMTPRVFDALAQRAEADQVLRLNEKAVWHTSHHVKFAPALASRVNQLLSEFERAPFSPPSVDEAAAAVGAEALAALIDQGVLEKISDQVIMTPQGEQVMKDWTVNAISERGQITAAELRDHFSTSRKYAIAFLEYLDQKRVTMRVGDARILR